VTDGLSPFTVEVDSLPVTPNPVWRLLQEARAFREKAETGGN
jgi:hypothetical protein